MARAIIGAVLCTLVSSCAIEPIAVVDVRAHMLYIDQKGALREPDESYAEIPRWLGKDDKNLAEATAYEGTDTYSEQKDYYEKLLTREGPLVSCREFVAAGESINDYTKAVENPTRPGTPEDKYVIKMIAGYCTTRGSPAPGKSGKKIDDITIFIHGGLNTQSSSVNRTYQVAGQMLGDDIRPSYPFFVGWRSGGISNYGAHVLYDRGGQHRPVIGPVTSPFILLEDSVRSIAKAPGAFVNTVALQLTVPKTIKTDDEKAYEAVRHDLIGDEMSDCENPIRNPRTPLHICRRGKDVGIGFWDSVQLLNPLKYVSAPLVDGFGTGSWTSMLRRTDVLLQRDAVYRGIDNSETALEKLLNGLGRLKEQPNITLIGHSMGTIVANNIIARHPTLNYQHVVYLAAAASVKDIEFAVVPLLLRNKQVTFYNLSLDPYREIIEPVALGSLPNGSLLTWIDSFFTQVASFSDRTAGTFYNIMRAADTVFPVEVRDRVYLTTFGLADEHGRDPGPQKHGDFGDYRFWVPGFWKGTLVERAKVLATE